MTCHHCETKSGVYDLTQVCCAARFVLSIPEPEKTAQSFCERYGHDMEALRAEAKRQRRAQA